MPSGEIRTMSKQQQPPQNRDRASQPQASPSPQAKDQGRKAYYVKGPGRFWHTENGKGQMVPAGTKLLLTPEEAKAAGAVVTEDQRKVVVSTAAREAGRYRVKFGFVSRGTSHKDRLDGLGGRTAWAKPGDTIELSREDARALGDQIEPA
jgi:hypothetical protein